VSHRRFALHLPRIWHALLLALVILSPRMIPVNAAP